MNKLLTIQKSPVFHVEHFSINKRLARFLNSQICETFLKSAKRFVVKSDFVPF